MVTIDILTIAFLLALFLTGRWWFLLLALPGLLLFIGGLTMRLLLFEASKKLLKRGILGVIVTSDSPYWHDYIQEHWIANYGGSFLVLNWSQRKLWRRDALPVRLVRTFLSEHDSSRPAVLLLNGLRPPLIFRFFYAFRDHKHGNPAALRSLEQRLDSEIAARRPGDKAAGRHTHH